MIDLNGRGAVTTTIRHECGHLVVARSLGFPTGGIHLSAAEAGASIDLLLSLKTMDEVLEFIERRVQVLYAGSLADTPMFLGCSDTDPHIPLARVKESTRVLGSLGAVVRESIYPDMGHTINDDEIARVRGLMVRLQGGAATTAG